MLGSPPLSRRKRAKIKRSTLRRCRPNGRGRRLIHCTKPQLREGRASTHVQVLFVAIGSSGDVHPLIGIGLAMRARGHDVTIAASAHFESLVRDVGLEFSALGTEEDYQTITSDPDLSHVIKGTRLVIRECCVRILRDVYELVADFHRPGESLVVASALALGARIAQEKLGIPVITTAIQPMIFRSLYATPRFGWLPMPVWTPRLVKRAVFRAADVYADSLARRAVNELRTELGLPSVNRIFNTWWLSPQLVIGLFPEWFGAPQPDWPTHTILTGFPNYDGGDAVEVSAEAREFVASGEPPIVFTPGSAMRSGRAFFEASAEACRMLGRRGMLLTKFHEHIPETLPEGVVHFDYLPFGGVLPHAAAMVHHGGMGTLAQTLRAGIPHLVMPMVNDQMDNAARLADLGVAEVVKPSAFRARTVADKLDRLLNSTDVQTECAKVAEAFQNVDAPAQTCEVIEEFAAKVL